MKKILTVTIFYLSSLNSFSQQITFQKIYLSFPQAGNEFVYEVIQTPDRGFLTGNRFLLLRTDSLGNKIWMKNMQSAVTLTLGTTYDGGYIAAGSYYIIKLNSNYAISWSKSFINLPSHLFYTIRETNDFGFILGAATTNADFLLVKCDSTGNVQWSKSYTTTQDLVFESLSVMNDNGYIMTGQAYDPVHSKLFIIKTDSLGNFIWSKKYFDSSSLLAQHHITRTSDGGYAITGKRSLHRYIIKIDSIGNKVWEKFYECGINGRAGWIEESVDHGLVVAGTALPNSSGQFAFLMKTDGSGNLEWSRLYGSGDVWGGGVKQTEDNGFIISARVHGSANSNDVFLIKTDSLGNTDGCLEDSAIVIVSNLNDSVISLPVTVTNANIITVDDSVPHSPMGSVLTLCGPVGLEEISITEVKIGVTPNPFTDKFTVSGLKFKVGEKANIIMYDLMGEKVFEKQLSFNKTEEEFNLSFLLRGVYFLNIKTNGESYIKKVVKMGEN